MAVPVGDKFLFLVFELAVGYDNIHGARYRLRYTLYSHDDDRYHRVTSSASSREGGIDTLMISLRLSGFISSPMNRTFLISVI